MKPNLRSLALRLLVVVPIALLVCSMSGCNSNMYKNRLVGHWVGPVSEYHFREDGLVQHCFWTASGPRWINGIYWITEANGDRARVHFHRTKPAPKETSTFICVFEKDDLIQVNKKHGKYRLIKVEGEINGKFKGPWSNQKYNPYWHTGRKT